MPHLSEQELVSELQTVANRLQRVPRRTDMDEIGRYSTQTYIDRFESWQTALQTAELADRREPHLPREDLSTYLEQLGNSLGRTPTRADVRDKGDLSPWVFSDRFESWLSALDTAGFNIAPRTTPANATATYSELRTTLTTLAEEIGRSPSQDDVNVYSDYASDLYIAAYGSWKDALRFAELPPNTLGGGPTYSTETLLNHLRDLAEQLETPPSASDLNEHGEYAIGTYQHRFGSWNDALRKAGLTPRETTDPLPTIETLVEEIQELASKDGRPPTPARMRTNGDYVPETYLLRFDSWGQALNAAGYDPSQAWKTSDG